MKDIKKSWDDHLPNLEFANNRVFYRITNLSPFDVVYKFNPLTPLDDLSLTIKKEYLEQNLLKGFMRRPEDKLKNKLKNMLNTTTKGERK